MSTETRKPPARLSQTALRSLVRAAVAVVVAWAVFGMFNPQGIPSHAVMLTCLFIVQKDEVAR